MKYLVILGDGMAGYPHQALGGKTALEKAKIPFFDRLASEGELGLVKTVPDNLPPGSDTANLSVLGYDPLIYYTGRAPFEAASLGIELKPQDVAFRCNLVTLSGEENYRNKTMVDYAAGEISTAEAKELISAVAAALGTELIRFYSGFRYRHIMVWQDGADDWSLTPPHDISGKKIAAGLPRGQDAALVFKMMEESYKLLAGHPINRQRVQKGLNPANSIWLWGNGRKPLLKPFKEEYGLEGAVISAVDLIKGLGILAGLKSIDVEGATGDIDTNYAGKVEAALSAFSEGHDFVYLHIEGPDECAHRFEAQNKVKAIELIDQKVLAPLLASLEKSGQEFSLLLAADHATPLSLGTHTHDPVPYAIYRSSGPKNSTACSYNEKCAGETGLYYAEGFKLMKHFLKHQ